MTGFIVGFLAAVLLGGLVPVLVDAVLVAIALVLLAAWGVCYGTSQLWRCICRPWRRRE